MTPFAFVGMCLLLAIAGIALLNKTQRLKELGDKVTALNFSFNGTNGLYLAFSFVITCSVLIPSLVDN